MMPWHSGPVCDLVGIPPVEIFAALGRLHAEFADHDLPVELERLDEQFVCTGLRGFGQQKWDGARAWVGEESRQRGLTLCQQMLEDEGFRTLGERGAVTLLHGDFYGLNVHLPGPDDASPLLIDWNCARVGPAMFDLAMTVGWDTDERRAHDDAWAQVTGHRPDEAEARVSHAWARALTHVMFAPVVALRGHTQAGVVMAREAERSWKEYRRWAK